MELSTSNKHTHLKQALLAISIVGFMSGCTTTERGSSTQAYKGVISLDAIRLGTPEETPKSATLSFVLDTNVPPPFAQYLSRSYDKDGGQYTMGFVNGKPRSLRVIYAGKPISREEALVKLKNILPADAPEETKLDDSEVKAGKKDSPVEKRQYGEDLKSEIIYADKEATKVKVVSVFARIKKDGAAASSEAAANPAADAKTDPKAE
ncbi:MAG: hypothetical protein K2Y39_19535 [Candidatus Obscuribacterales bacterium]|nr:hypothetical protein [Candidatus Obscuribacterales bacterium]